MPEHLAKMQGKKQVTQYIGSGRPNTAFAQITLIKPNQNQDQSYQQ